MPKLEGYRFETTFGETCFIPGHLTLEEARKEARRRFKGQGKLFIPDGHPVIVAGEEALEARRETWAGERVLHPQLAATEYVATPFDEEGAARS